MVVLRGVGVLLVLLLGSILALVQPASAAPALIATEPPRPPDNVQADHAGMADDDSSPSEPASSAIPATADDGATTQPTPPQDPDPDPSDPEVASSPSVPSVPSASEAPEADAPPAATPTPSSAPSSGLAPATTPTADSSVVVAAVDPEDDGLSDEGNFDDGNISAQAAAAAATTMAAAIPSAPSIHTLGGLLAYTGAGLGLTLAMACLLVIGALALWLSRRESETAPAFF
ncbi:hypothetical protein AM609_11465 [Actinomyces sp. oral taxon 414]|nr:hypothetical protein AM609_11465 [Actinomyces sp. oral taxon 414]